MNRPLSNGLRVHRPIVLLSDFGTHDPYVGIVKAVISGIAPEARLIDLTHEIPPQGVEAASFVLAAALPWLPHASVVWAVVDPGVGTDRAAIGVAARLGSREFAFIAPDNGILTECLDMLDDVRCARLDDPRFHVAHPGTTFHGRDVFGPAAAHVALGTHIADLGTAVRPDEITRLGLERPVKKGPAWHGRVRWIDRFGDLVTDIPAHVVWEGSWSVEIGAARVDGISHTFGSVPEGDPVAYVGSWGTLEIAVRGGNAAARWGLGVGAEVRAEPRTDERL